MAAKDVVYLFGAFLIDHPGLDGIIQYIFGYAVCYVKSDSDRNAVLTIGSDDGYNIFFNGGSDAVTPENNPAEGPPASRGQPPAGENRRRLRPDGFLAEIQLTGKEKAGETENGSPAGKAASRIRRALPPERCSLPGAARPLRETRPCASSPDAPADAPVTPSSPEW